MGKPTGFLVDVQGVGFVPLCISEGSNKFLYASFFTVDGGGQVRFPHTIDNPADLRDLGYATLQAHVRKPGKSGNLPEKPKKKTVDPMPEKPEISKKKPKKRGALDGII